MRHYFTWWHSWASFPSCVHLPWPAGWPPRWPGTFLSTDARTELCRRPASQTTYEPSTRCPVRGGANSASLDDARLEDDDASTTTTRLEDDGRDKKQQQQRRRKTDFFWKAPRERRQLWKTSSDFEWKGWESRHWWAPFPPRQIKKRPFIYNDRSCSWRKHEQRHYRTGPEQRVLRSI